MVIGIYNYIYDVSNKVFDRKEQLGLVWEKEVHGWGTNLSSEVSKRQIDDQILKAVALHTKQELYPDNEWLHVFIDCSMLTYCINAGVFCMLFSFFTPIGRYKSAFVAEISAIQIALSQLQCQSENFSRSIILSDSRAALLAISSPEAPILNIRLARRRDHYQLLIEFEQGRVIGLREGGFSLHNIAERLGQNVSTVHDCRRLQGTTERKDGHVRRTAVVHHTASAGQIRAAVGIKLQNELL
ncbi:HTH_Tnp_Tc3_2 domain-containing protein [Trichonephila clavipes]|nr:HTH_Tnp_Tc3_2 domain-containing protein [Trichonephila clavipes]